MSYKVQIPKPIKDEIASWNLPRELLVQVYIRLHADLADKPKENLRMVIAPIYAHVFDFTLHDDLGRQHLCIFYLTFDDDLGVIYVRYCHHVVRLKEEP